MPMRHNVCHGVILFIFIFITTAMLNTKLREHARDQVLHVSTLAREQFHRLQKTETKAEMKMQIEPDLSLLKSTAMAQLRSEAANYIEKYPLGKPTPEGVYDPMLGPLPFAYHMECLSEREPFEWLYKFPPIRLHISYWSTAEEAARRQLIRTLMQEWQQRLQGDIVDYHFLLGRAANNASQAKLSQENSTYGDLALLNMAENYNDGKGWYQKEWEASSFIKGNSSRYDFFAKADMDTFIHVKNLALHLRSLPKTKTVYGKEAFSGRYVPFMLGMLNVLSADIVSEIAEDENAIRYWQQDGTGVLEDIRQGRYIKDQLKVNWISEGCLFTDDPRRDVESEQTITWVRKRWVSPDTICVHRLKRHETWYAVVDLYM